MYGRNLDDFGDHAILCGKSASRYRFHRAVARAIVSFCRETGLDAAEEVVVPELLQGEPGTDNAVEAKLDIHIWGVHPTPLEEWADVRANHPWRRKLRGQATDEDGAAAEDAEKRKDARYGVGQ